MSAFERETAVRRVAADRWVAHVADRWNIGENPNGGYLVAIVLRALREVSAHPDPISVTTHFLRPASAGQPAEVTAEVIRSGRTVTTVRATLAQSGTARVTLLAALSDLSGPAAVDDAVTLPAPGVEPPESCVLRSEDVQGIALPLLDRVEVRLDPAQAVLGSTGSALVTGWITLTDGTEPDVVALPLFADAFPPSLFGLLGAVGWVPTVEITVHVRRRPAPGWVLGRFVCEDLHEGRMIEDGALWDSTGALVAQSRQIGLLLPR